MMGEPTNFLVAVLAAILIVAGAGDLRTRRIPNRLTVAVAVLALPFWWFAGLQPWPDIAVQLGLALLVLLAFNLVFQLGWMGGGDVKLLAALALWLPPKAMLMLLVIMSVAGGVLTIFYALRHRRAKATGTAEGPVEVPYGVAIVFGGLWLIGERFLNQFG